jgi:SAM-dependent methyltransferase
VSADGLSRHYVKLCDLRDFDDPRLRARLREVVPGRPPQEELHRKFWEYAMLTLFLEDSRLLNDGTSALAVGAGHEAVLYWLANHVGRVVATDIYGEGDFAAGEAEASMLRDPAAYAPYPYREDRLDVMHMDARKLDFPDGSFDAVFSLSSIEHFGGPADVAQAAREIGRVLRPGGRAAIVTECFLSWHPADWPPLNFALRVATGGRRAQRATPRRRVIDVFTPRELKARIVRPSGLRLMQPLERDVSPETLENVTRMDADAGLHPATGSFWPHLVVRAGGAPWTSVFLALEKPG